MSRYFRITQHMNRPHFFLYLLVPSVLVWFTKLLHKGCLTSPNQHTIEFLEKARSSYNCIILLLLLSLIYNSLYYRYYNINFIHMYMLLGNQHRTLPTYGSYTAPTHPRIIRGWILYLRNPWILQHRAPSSHPPILGWILYTMNPRLLQHRAPSSHHPS